MRILHLLNHVHLSGNGIVTVVCDLACEQSYQGMEVAVASSGGSLDSVLAERGVRHFYVQQNKQFGQAIKGAWQLWRLIAKWRPDVIHAHMMTGVVLAWLNKPFYKFSLISTVHNEFQREAILMGLADRVIAISTAVRDRLIQRGIRGSKIDVVRNGVIGGLRADIAPLNQIIHRPSLMTVAGLNARKGIPDLLKAFNIVANLNSSVHLYLLGDGSQRGEYEDLRSKCKFKERIHFEGFCPNVKSFLKEADIMILPSHEEPFGLVIAEAREMGVAVIATDVGGIPEVLEFGKSGILVPPHSPSALSEAILFLLQAPDELARWRTRASQNLDWLTVKRMTSETNIVYENSLQSRSIVTQVS